MPQFDPSTWPPQIVWLIITFVALYFLMAKVALPRISEILDERDFRINDSLRKAEGLKQDAEDAVAAYEQRMAEARAKAQEQVRDAREEAAAEAARRHAALSERLSEEISAAEARIEAARREALEGIQAVSAEVAAMAVERLIGQRPAPAKAAAAVDQVLKEAR
jgi:F-type H+-transporting ATPase subunit b